MSGGVRKCGTAAAEVAGGGGGCGAAGGAKDKNPT